MLARTSIKSAGVAELIGRLVQGRSDLAMQEESLVKLEREPFARGANAGKVPVSSIRS